MFGVCVSRHGTRGLEVSMTLIPGVYALPELLGELHSH